MFCSSMPLFYFQHFPGWALVSHASFNYIHILDIVHLSPIWSDIFLHYALTSWSTSLNYLKILKSFVGNNKIKEDSVIFLELHLTFSIADSLGPFSVSISLHHRLQQLVRIFFLYLLISLSLHVFFHLRCATVFPNPQSFI